MQKIVYTYIIFVKKYFHAKRKKEIMRLDKFLSNALGVSRSQVKEQLKKKQVLVNGQIICDGSYAVAENCDEIFFMGKEVVYEKYSYYMFHKPAGCITAKKDKEQKTVFDYLEGLNTKELFAVGRLDKDTEGLLFLTNDGAFDHSLMSPKKHVDKTYYFEADGVLSEEDIASLENGVSIGKDEPLTKPARVYDVVQKELSYLTEHGMENQRVSGKLVITEGRFHQVKRMLKAVGCEVTYLKRIAIGHVVLDESLEKGSYRKLTEGELAGFR